MSTPFSPNTLPEIKEQSNVAPALPWAEEFAALGMSVHACVAPSGTLLVVPYPHGFEAPRLSAGCYSEVLQAVKSEEAFQKWQQAGDLQWFSATRAFLIPAWCQAFPLPAPAALRRLLEQFYTTSTSEKAGSKFSSKAKEGFYDFEESRNKSRFEKLRRPQPLFIRMPFLVAPQSTHKALDFLQRHENEVEGTLTPGALGLVEFCKRWCGVVQQALEEGLWIPMSVRECLWTYHFEKFSKLNTSGNNGVAWSTWAKTFKSFHQEFFETFCVNASAPSLDTSLLERSSPPDSLKNFLENWGNSQWRLMPHLHWSQVLAFAHGLNAIMQKNAISIDTTPLGRAHSAYRVSPMSSFTISQRAKLLESSGTMGLKNALQFLFRLTFEVASDWQKNLTAQREADFFSHSERIEAWKRRNQGSGFLSAIYASLPIVLPPALGHAILADVEKNEAVGEVNGNQAQVHAPELTQEIKKDDVNDSHDAVLLEPAVLRLEVSLLTQKQREKSFSTLREQFVTLPELEQLQRPFELAHPGSYWLADSVALGPVTAQLLRYLLAQISIHLPLLGCSQMFTHGRARVSTLHLQQLSLKQEGKELSSERHVSWITFESLAAYATPLFERHALCSSSIPMPQVFGSVPLISPIIQETAKKDVRFGFRYELAQGSAYNGMVEEALTALKGLLKQRASGAMPQASSADTLGFENDQQANFFSGMEDRLKRLAGELVFEAQPFFVVEGQTFTEKEWASAKKSGDMYQLPYGIRLPAWQYEKHLDIYLTRKRAMQRFGTLTASEVWGQTQAQSVSGKSEKSDFDAASYLASLDVRLSEDVFRAQGKLAEELANALTQQPVWADLNPPLRPYQKSGAAWLYVQTTMGFGVCLADEMGLGKTPQAIAFLRLLFAKHHSESAQSSAVQVLIVVPKSLLLNWARELARFAPQFKVGMQDGTSTPWENLQGCDVVLTTYPRLRRDALEFKSRTWACVVLDEAHIIKNARTQIAQAVRAIPSARRIALTGTPLENHARELWSLCDWLNPGWLGREPDFVAYTQLARSTEHKRDMLRPVQACLQPVLLRRTKASPLVEFSLPDKIYSDTLYGLSDEQRIVYATLLESCLSETAMAATSFLRQAKYLKTIIHLKQVCNHPETFYNGQEDDELLLSDTAEKITAEKKPEAMIDLAKMRKILKSRLQEKKLTALVSHDLDSLLARSGKLQAFYDCLCQLKESGDGGILIFTQFRATAKLIQKLLSWSEVPEWMETPFLDGQLNAEERMDMVDTFQARCQSRQGDLARNRAAGAPHVLILSLKSGGQGLNLTGATTVLHYDRWWNPAVEDQATDRAHRIGQRFSVAVNTFSGKGTLEESIAIMLEEKRGLARDLVDMGSGTAAFESLKSEGGFLNLVDPAGVFRQEFSNTNIKGQAHQLGTGAQPHGIS